MVVSLTDDEERWVNENEMREMGGKNKRRSTYISLNRRLPG